jgi:hypothetical protein
LTSSVAAGCVDYSIDRAAMRRAFWGGNKSIVSHYFARGAAAFHDSQGTPAWTTPADDD